MICELSFFSLGIMLTIQFALCIFAIINIVLSTFVRQKKHILVWSVLVFVVTYTEFQVMCDYVYRIKRELPLITVFEWFAKLKTEIMLVITFSVAIACLLIFTYTMNCLKNSLSTMSYKHAADDLPMGLCFYVKNGPVLLINERLEKICFSLTGNFMTNADDFCKQIEFDESGKTVTKRYLPDGTAWLFEKSTISTSHGEIVQMTAKDITDLSKHEAMLLDEISKLNDMNSHLKRYNDMVYELTKEEEMLDTKVRIHDSLGRLLIVTGQYIRGDNEYENKLNRLWKSSFAQLVGEAESKIDESMVSELTCAADLVGAEIVFAGDFPDNSKISSVIAACILECLNNAVHHGNATIVYAEIEKQSGVYRVKITNNGSPPPVDFTEGGGIKGIRNKVKNIGGFVSVFRDPEFVVEIILPEEQ